MKKKKTKSESDKLYNPRDMHFGKGLQPTPEDNRDFSLGAVFGQIDIKDVPLTDWDVGTPFSKIKDQGPYDFCAAYMATSISEDQEEEELGAIWQFAVIKEMMGDFTTWGADLRTALLSMVNIGSIPAEKERSFLAAHPKETDRNWLADIRNWPVIYKEIAKKYKKCSVFEITGRYDAFDNVRAALWQHKDKKCSAACGVMWRYNWENAKDGVIPNSSEGNGEGHALKIRGQKMIKGEPHLKLHNSWGDKVGDQGFFYVNRKMFNKHFPMFKFFMVKDLARDTAQYLNDNNLTINHVWWVDIWLFIKKLFTANTH